MSTHPQEQLGAARRQWLSGLVRQHAAAGTWASALALAQGEYMCGEYPAALGHFIEARDLAPDRPETQLALVRMASTLARRDLERDSLADALRRLPDFAPLALHAALRDVPERIDAARAHLRRFPHDAACAEFDRALEAIEHGRPVQTRAEDPAGLARASGMRWVQAHARCGDVFHGLPVDVLLRALELAPAGGLTLECGVYFGRSLRLIAERTDGTVHGFDSFQGLPEAWSEREGAGAYSTAGELPAVAANARLHPGWFQDTLPSFLADHEGPVRLLHVDCDLYSSTRTVLEHLDERLVAGSIVVFDDLLGYAGYEEHELRAFLEFAGQRGLRWEIVAAAVLGREVAVRVTGR